MHDNVDANVRAFAVESLEDMGYDVSDLTDDTTLGPAGLDLESLALADLAVRVEDRYGLKFADDESEQLALMTVGEFCAFVVQRLATETATESAAERAETATEIGGRAGEPSAVGTAAAAAS